LWLELPQDKDGNGNDDNTDQHPTSGNQALDILVAHPGLMATVETKYTWSQTRMNRLRDVIKDKGLMNRVIIHSFNLDHVKYAKTAGFPLRGYVVNSDVATLPSAAYVKTYANYVFVPLARLTAAKAGEYQAAGLKVAVWTLDNTTEYDQALAKKADIWICNDIKEAKEYLEQAA
jgi:glycerophosphoryl diester phosphodiesterase